MEDSKINRICIHRLKTIFYNNKKLIIKCFAYTYIIGLIAHGFMYFNNDLSHDSFIEFSGNESVRDWKISLGRIFWPAYMFFTRGFVTLPWLIGVFALLWLSLAVFLTAKIFDIDEKQNVVLVLISAVYTVNITVIAETATYIHDLDVNMFAMLMAVISVYVLKRFKYGFLYGSLPLMIAIGLYQSYISVAISLILILCIFQLLKAEDFKHELIKGLKGVIMLLCACVLFFAAFKATLEITGVAMTIGTNNSMDNAFELTFDAVIKNTLDTYDATIRGILVPKSVVPSFFVFRTHFVMVGCLCLTGFILWLKIKWRSKILVAVLTVLLPLGMNVCCVLTNNNSHDLMYYSLNYTYLLALLVFDYSLKTIKGEAVRKIKKYSVAVLSSVGALILAVTMLCNIRTANMLYTIKNIEHEATLSFFTKISYSIERQSDYIAGETKVAFIGEPEALIELEGTSAIKGIVGMAWGHTLGVNKQNRFQEYFNRILKLNVCTVSEEEATKIKLNKDVIKMPSYPAEGSVKYIDDVLVVKLGRE